MTEATNTTIATTLTHRDRTEFEQLIARTKRQAYNIAYRMTGNREDAEDLTQEAYLRAFRSFDKFNRSLPFENWFFRILSNLFIDRLRRKPKLAPLSLDHGPAGGDGEDEFAFDIPDYESNPERTIMRDVMDERLQNAIAAMPKDFRTAVLLCDIQEMSYEEIAQAMNTSVGTVRSRIHRGRQMLRKGLEGKPMSRRGGVVLAPVAA